jgi:hypothetical protein
MNRGDRRELIFMDDADRQRFVDTLGGGLRQDGLAGSRLCPHAESFPLGGRDAAAQSGRRDEMVAGH